MFNRVSKASRLAVAWAVCCAGMTGMPVVAEEGMRPVPRFSGTSIRDQRTETQKAASASNLQWRVSSEVAPAVKPAPAAAAVVAPQNTAPQHADSVATVRYVQEVEKPLNPRIQGTAAPIQQARYQNDFSMPGDAGGLQLPPGLQTSPAPETPPADAAKPLPDFFTDPFGAEPAVPAVPPAANLPEGVQPPINNELRAPSTLGQPAPPQALEVDELPPPSKAPAKSPAEAVPANPFDKTRSPQDSAADDADRRQLEDFELPFSPDRTPEREPRSRAEDEVLLRPVQFSCDEFRKSIAEATIQKVSLDISPPFRPDVIEWDEFRKLKSKFDEGQDVRDWQSVDGRKLGRGRLRDLAYEKIVIETEFGTMEELPINRISEADLAFLSKNWGLPQECLIEQAAYEPRSWQHSKVTWKASNLCHKPLYFEEVNLERYGHTAGPFAQPLISSAHFFVNIAVLPYKMGVHAPSECQYTLGYYRPGNCAPWIVPPVPISLRGGLYQAAAMTGAFWLIP